MSVVSICFARPGPIVDIVEVHLHASGLTHSAITSVGPAEAVRMIAFVLCLQADLSWLSDPGTSLRSTVPAIVFVGSNIDNVRESIQVAAEEAKAQ